MKRSLSVFLSLVLLVSSLVIPMSVSAETTIDSASLIEGIKTAATNLEYNENQREQPFVPLGIFSNDPNYSKVQENVIASDDKAVVGSKVIRIPNEFGTTSDFWGGMNAGTDAVVSYQPGYNSSALDSANHARIQKSQLKSISFTVKTNRKLNFVLKTHSGEGFNDYMASVEAAPGVWQTVKLNINGHFNGDQTLIKSAFVVVNDENTSVKGFGEGAEVYFGGFFVETVDENVTAVKNITGTDTTALANCIVAAEKIDTSRYTDATVTDLKSAITAAKKALVSNYIENNDISSLTGFVDKEIKILSKTEILFVANFGRYLNDGKLGSTELLTKTDAAADGYTSKYSYPFADENWRYMSGNLAMLHFVAPGYTSYTDNGLVGVQLSDYDDIYLYMVDTIKGSSSYSDWFTQFGALKKTDDWIGNGVTDNNGHKITAVEMTKKLLTYLNSRNYTKPAAPLKTKMPIKLNGEYIINDGSYEDAALTKAFQAFYKKAAFDTPCEVAFSPIYGVNYCKTPVADKTSINEVLTAVNSINVNEWDNGSIIEDTSKAMKEALLEDPSANLEDLKAILLSELADAGIVEEVWQPRYQHNGSNWDDPVNNVSSSLSSIISGYNNELGSFVTKMNSSYKTVSLVSSNATTSNGNGSTPINVDDYDDMWLYVYNNTSGNLTPSQFLIVSTPDTGSKNSDEKEGLTFPANSLTRIDVAKILKKTNTVMPSTVPNWNTNRIQFQIGSLSGTQDVYCGTVFGLKKLDTTDLASANTYADIFAFYDQNVKNNKGLQNADDAISTFKAIRTSIATSENVDDIKDLLLYELGNVGTVEEIWRPMWSASHDGNSWQWGKANNAINDSEISDNKDKFGEFAVKLDSTYQLTSVTDAGAPNQQPNVGPFLNVDDYLDIWMYAYYNNSGTIKANNFMVVSAGSNTYGLTAPALNNGLNRIELYNNLVAASTGIKADKDGTKNMVRLQIQYNTNKIPEGAAVYYGSVLGIKKIDTSELVTAKRMGDIIEFYDNNIGGKSLVDANGDASTEAADLVDSIRGGLSTINATLNDDTFVTPTDDCGYTLKYAKEGAEFKFNVDVKNGGTVNSVTYGGETVAPVGDVYTITVNNAKTLVITTNRDTYATVDGKLKVESGDQRDIFNHSTSNNQSTWSTKKDKINGESVVYQESVLFYEGRSNVKLMYPVSHIVAVTSYSTVNGEFVRYYAGKNNDFVVNADGTISLTANSSIPHGITLDEIKTGTQGKDIWNSASIWDKELPKNQVLVTYTYKGTWDGVDYDMPTYVNKLTTAYDKLKDSNEALDVLFIGDSITTGCNASGQSGEFYSYSKDAVGPKNTVQGWKKYLGLNVDSAPYWVNDSWDKQVVANLKTAYGEDRIGTVTNRAVGSSASEWYMNHIDELLVTGELGNVDLPNTDLVFIGFGMNEHSDTKQTHINKIKNIINYLRDKNSNVSIVLVSAFYPTFWNSEKNAWNNFNLGVYEDGYMELANEYDNIAVAPVNTAFANVLGAKEGVDYIANGVNHPNDYGVNLYANVINSTLVGSASIDAPNAMYLYNQDGKATYDDNGTEKTAVYLFAQYQSPVVDGNVDPTQIILSDGTEGTVVSRTIYLATKANAENLGDAFGKTNSTKVKFITVDGANLSKCWSSDTDNKLVTYGVKASGITSVNRKKPLAVRGKIVYKDAQGVEHTIYSNVQTSDYFSAQGAYNVLYRSNQDLVWFTNN